MTQSIVGELLPPETKQIPPATLIDIQNNILQLQQALLSDHPQMPVLLRTIHQQLKADPDCVTLLTEEEIAEIVKGLSKQTKVEITTQALKSSKKSLKSITIDDL